MRVYVNNDEKTCDAASTVRDFLLTLDLNPQTVVVERNGEILPAAAFAETHLEEDDRLEVLQFVGGG